ncbi:MAG: HAD family hydrolase [Bacteroides sp.]|nr:HAD family hydrolase [Bacteroides sp.]
MDKFQHIKGIIFDYGGTIDTNGHHWGEVLWNAYCRLGIEVSYEQFWDAYVYGERTMGKMPLVKPEDDFYQTLLIKTKLEIGYLIEHDFLPDTGLIDSYPEKISSVCDQHVKEIIAQARPVLECLAAKYPLMLVSNFYGNVKQALTTYGIDHYFIHIIDSTLVNCRKPDPAIFHHAFEILGLPVGEILMIGDTLKNDIHPARNLGCKTIWIKPEINGDEPDEADITITNFATLQQIL